MQRNTSPQIVGKTFLGVELGSTRIKAVLIDSNHTPVASGGFAWENRLENGVWTYSLQDVWKGLAACFADLARDLNERYGADLSIVSGMGVSAMMHGYLAFDADGELLVPFRTWRNTMTGEAADALSKLFGFNIPQRWSSAHLYQAILSGEAHVRDVRSITTLSGYIHWQLTGRRCLGIDDCSGMFPIDEQTKQFDAGMLAKFDALAEPHGFDWKLLDLLPEVLCAGEFAGALSEAGALRLDPTGKLPAGTPLCPPEGDAGTGMVATNSILPRTGNVSAGTSIFLMAVLEKRLSRWYPEIDIVSTPSGDPVAMVHCNNCTSDIDAWIRVLGEAASALGAEVKTNALYETLYKKALEGDADCGGLLAYNYLSGEHVTGFTQGRPMLVRKPESRFTLANLMRAQLSTALGALASGMKILEQEEVALDSVTGHGGYFKTEGVGQRLLAAALDAPVSVMSTAGEGGPWGAALLSAYACQREANESLADYLKARVFQDASVVTTAPRAEDAAGFSAFMHRYQDGLAIERAAVEHLD